MIHGESFVIYKHTSPNGKVYIGQTKNYLSRCEEHKKNKDRSCFQAAVKKWGWDNFEHVILEENLTLEEANRKEILYIKIYNSLSPNGYNVASGGRNKRHAGVKKTLEQRQAISLRQKGKVISEEQRLKISKALTGLKRTKEQITANSLRQKGCVRSEEFKEKIRMSMTEDRKKLLSEVKLGTKDSNEVRAKKSAAQRKRRRKELFPLRY